MNRSSTAAWHGDSTVIPQQNVATRTAAIQTQAQPATNRSLISRMQALWPYVAGGFVVLAVIKLLYEKFVVHDEAELRGVRIGWYNFIAVGVMAMVFSLGTQVVAGGIAQFQSSSRGS